MRSECDKTKQAIQISKEVHLTKDKTICELNEEIRQLTTSSMKPAIKPIKFKDFMSTVSEKCLSELRSLDDCQEKDPSFVRIALKSLYSTDLSVLQHKSLTGGQRNMHNAASDKKGCEFEKISPAKMHTLKGLFDERISDLDLNEIGKSRRRKGFRRHISKAIANINAFEKTKKKKIIFT